jgi:signal transduction histidine kinase
VTNISERVLVLAPLLHDASVAAQVLHDAGFYAEPCTNIDEFCEHLKDGCGVLVVAEEALHEDSKEKLLKCLREQPTWSDVPVILLTSGATSNTWNSFSTSGSVTILERPFGKLTLLRAVDVGIRARRKQYQVCDLMEEQLQASRMRDEFFASLSHELRTPLNVILGWTEVLRGGTLSREAQAEALNILERNAQVQKSLIDDLLDTSRIITGKLHLDCQPLSLNRMLSSLRTSMLLRARQKHQILILNLPDHECFVKADESRLSKSFHQR